MLATLALLLLCAAGTPAKAPPRAAPKPVAPVAAAKPSKAKPAPAIAACTPATGGRTAAQLTPSDVGHTIVLEGEITTGPALCTKMKCAAKPCCNTCGAPMVIAADEKGPIVHVATAFGDETRCGGNECSITCAPLETGKYRLTGTLKRAGLAVFTYDLDVVAACRL